MTYLFHILRIFNSVYLFRRYSQSFCANWGRVGQGRAGQAPKSESCELDANSLKTAEQPRQDSGQGRAPKSESCEPKRRGRCGTNSVRIRC